MNTKTFPFAPGRCITALALLCAAVSTACGDGVNAHAGADNSTNSTQRIGTSTSTNISSSASIHTDAETRARATAAVSPATVSASPAQGHPTPAEAEAQVLSGRYLSGRQAEDLATALRGDVVWVSVPCCGEDQRAMAILVAYGMQAAQNLPNDVPFLVRGVNLREAAAVANRLTRSGLTRVVLVTS